MLPISRFPRRLLGAAVHAALLASLSLPAFAGQVVADGTDVRVPGGDYDNDGQVGPDKSVFFALRGGTITAEGPVNLRASGAAVNGAYAEGLGSAVTLDGGRIDVTGNFSDGLYASRGGLIDARNLVINKTGIGHGVNVENAGSQVRLANVEINTAAADSHGVVAFLGGMAELTDTRIRTRGFGSMGINANRGDPTLRLQRVEVTTEGDYAAALWLLSNGVVNGQDVQFSTLGNYAPGVDVRDGQVDLRRGTIRTSGVGSHGLYASSERAGGALLRADALDIGTTGTGAIGIVVRNGAQVSLTDSSVHTTGTRGHALLVSGNDSVLNLMRTSVLAQGEQAWGLRIDGGTFNMAGGTLGSERHGAISVSGASQLNFSDGAQLFGGDGRLLVLEGPTGAGVGFNLDNGVQAQGDIVHADGTAGPDNSGLQMALDGRSHWQGATDIVDGMRISNGSRWTITGDSTIGSLVLGGGVLAFEEPEDGERFNVLTIKGNYHSDNGTLVLNGRLEGDGAPSDRLLVEGDTSGRTWVVVNNVGGLGPTTADGIEVVTVNGRSDGEFVQRTRVVRALHEYFLHQGGVEDPDNGHWYLRSVLPPDPEDPKPDPDPVLRPEPGVYWANQTAALAMFQHGLHDRLGARLPHPGREQRGAWGRSSQQQENYGLQAGQLKLRSHRTLRQTGTDLYGNDSTRVGVMFGHGQARNQSTSIATGYQAQGRVDGMALGLYASWLEPSQDQRGLQLDSWLQWARYRHKVEGVGLAAERYTARSAAASVELGYALPLQLGQFTTLYVEPQLQVTYTGYTAGRHVERNGTVVAMRGAGGLATRTGVRLYGQRGTPGAHAQQHAWVQPYLTVNWLRNSHATDALRFDEQIWTGDVRGDQVEAKLGAQLQLGPRLSGWGEFALQSGQRQFRGVGGQLGLRYHW